MAKPREPSLEEIEAVLAAAQDADGNDRYLAAWREELTPAVRGAHESEPRR